MTERKKRASLKCDVCGRHPKQNPLLKFVRDSKSGLFLCHYCIDSFSLAIKYISDSQSSAEKKEENEQILPSPREIRAALDKDIIKQDEAKEVIAIAVAHHYRRLRDPSIGKSNVLIIGPTGTGKTELARSVAKYLNVPFATADASTFTAKGYVGEDTESAIQRLLIAANWNPQEAEKGIVFIDEIDKLASKKGSDLGVGTTSVQQQLLKLMEGEKVKIKIPHEDGRESVTLIDTSKILFICSGAFVGLEDIVESRGEQLNAIGFHRHNLEAERKPVSLMEKLQPAKHLVQFGLIPELLGRLPIVVATEYLTESDLNRILVEPQNSLCHQFERLFLQDNVSVTFSSEFLMDVSREAVTRGMGARGLKQVMEKVMRKLFYDIDQYKNKHIEILKNAQVKISKTKSAKILDLSTEGEKKSSPVRNAVAQ